MKVADKTDVQLRWLQEDNETFASWGAWSVFLGLLVEIWFAAEISIGDWADKPWLYLIPDFLIALGVLAEIQFGRRSATATKELEKRALDRASSAERELIEFRKPRRKILEGKIPALVEKLKPFERTPFDAGIGATGEEMHFWWDLAHALAEARWSHLPWIDNTGQYRIQAGIPGSGQVWATNVEIHIRPEFRVALGPAAACLTSALREAGIEAEDVGCNCHSHNAHAIHILIGAKA